jgi:nucleotide-binding universal stress UspA family protein
MYETILLPTDGSDAMEAVIQHTVAVARGRDATVHVLYVVDDRAFLTLEEGMQAEVVAELRREGERATGAAADRLRADDLDVVTEIRRGSPADVVLDYVTEAGVDLVTMGTRGADYRRNNLGSVSREVTARADVPVMTVNIADVTEEEPGIVPGEAETGADVASDLDAEDS